MTAPAFVDAFDFHTDELDELDVDLLMAIDPQALARASRPALTVVDGGLTLPAADSDRHEALARTSITRGESEMVEVYRRRRFIAALAVTAIVIALAWAAGLSITSFGAAASSTDGIPVVHVVSVGDTYPSIATELGVDDPTVFAETLRAANGQAELVPGQRLVVNLAAFG